MLKLSIFLAVSILFTGCANNRNLVGHQGNSLDTRYSLQDRRAAKTHIRVTDSVPINAAVMSDYTVERCHQYAQNTAPSDAVLVDDLVMLAYAEGADGLTNLRFERESGLLKNCWSIAKGTATFYKQNR